MRSAILISILASLAAALPTTSVEALEIAKRIVARAPADANAVLKSVTSSGTGCATNSAAFTYLDGASVAFDSFVLDAIDPVNSKKNCLITIDLSVDPKWKYTINKRTTLQGFTDGASATFSAVYTVGGKQSTSTADISLSAGNFAVTLTQAGATSAYGGGVATIDINMVLKQRVGQIGYVVADSLDVDFEYSN